MQVSHLQCNFRSMMAALLAAMCCASDTSMQEMQTVLLFVPRQRHDYTKGRTCSALSRSIRAALLAARVTASTSGGMLGSNSNPEVLLCWLL
jgi:hypothetical protein